MAGQRAHNMLSTGSWFHISLYFLSQMFLFFMIFYAFLFFLFFLYFFPSAGRDDRPLYCTVPCNEAWQFDVWMMFLDCGFKCLGAFFKISSKVAKQ